MTILMWISRWQNEMELMIMGLQIILFLFLTIGVFLYCAATEKSKPVQKTPGIVLKKKHMDKPKKKEKKSVSPENVQNKNLHEDEEENRIISTVFAGNFPIVECFLSKTIHKLTQEYKICNIFKTGMGVQ